MSGTQLYEFRIDMLINKNTDKDFSKKIAKMSKIAFLENCTKFKKEV